MKPKYHDNMYKRILIWLWLALPLMANAAGDKDKDKNPVSEKPVIVNTSAGNSLSSEMQAALNRSVANLESQLAKAENKQAIDKMLDVKEAVTAVALEERTQAIQLFSYLDANQDHLSPIENFSLDQTKTLPIGAYTGNGNRFTPKT